MNRYNYLNLSYLFKIKIQDWKKWGLWAGVVAQWWRACLTRVTHWVYPQHHIKSYCVSIYKINKFIKKKPRAFTAPIWELWFLETSFGAKLLEVGINQRALWQLLWRTTLPCQTIWFMRRYFNFKKNLSLTELRLSITGYRNNKKMSFPKTWIFFFFLYWIKTANFTPWDF